MGVAEKIYENIKNLPEDKLADIEEYIDYIRYKEKKHKEQIMDDFIDENLEALKELAK